jgi:hypothetical protein
LDALSQGVELLARKPQLARQASRRLALGHATQQEHQRGRSLSGVREGRTGQQGIVAVAAPTTVCRELPLFAEQAPLHAPTARACHAARVQVALQPPCANTVVEQFGHREVDHASTLSPIARWLHMSQENYRRSFIL